MMYRKVTLFAIALFISLGSTAQTATDFTCNDCQGVSHHLFAELDAGKVIVLDWVMPCGACTGPSLTTYNVVQSYSASHPGKVIMYVSDDYGDTPCPSLISWCNSIGLNGVTTFSNAAINMMDYGSTGMPKVVVIGGGNHTVFYNADNSVNPTALQTAINDALSVSGIPEQQKLGNSFTVSPNPSAGKAVVTIVLDANSNVDLQLFDLSGRLIKKVFSGNLWKGENRIDLNTEGLDPAMYLLKAGSGSKNNFVNLMVSK